MPLSHRLCLAAAGLALAPALPAAAAVLLDTGQSPYVGRGGMGIDQMRIAAGFDTPATTLTAVQWGMGAISYRAGPPDRQLYTFHVVLYRANGGVPGEELYRAPARFNGQPGWHGVSGLAWRVPAGSYFVAIETRDDDACECWVSEGTPRPAARYAIVSAPGRPWIATPKPLGSAVRIEASDTP